MKNRKEKSTKSVKLQSLYGGEKECGALFRDFAIRRCSHRI